MNIIQYMLLSCLQLTGIDVNMYLNIGPIKRFGGNGLKTILTFDN